MPIESIPGTIDAMQLPLRLAIADEEARFREGARSLLNGQPDLCVVAEIAQFRSAPAVLAVTPVDVLVSYLVISEETLPLVQAIAARVAVVALVPEHDRDTALCALRAGVRGVLLRRLAFDVLVDALRTVAQGHVWIPPHLQAPIIQYLAVAGEQLTTREREITRCVAEGWRNGEVARHLLISEQTVKKHLHSIFRKLGVRDRVELIRHTGAYAGTAPHPPSHPHAALADQRLQPPPRRSWRAPTR